MELIIYSSKNEIKIKFTLSDLIEQSYPILKYILNKTTSFKNQNYN